MKTEHCQVAAHTAVSETGGILLDAVNVSNINRLFVANGFLELVMRGSDIIRYRISDQTERAMALAVLQEFLGDAWKDDNSIAEIIASQAS